MSSMQCVACGGVFDPIQRDGLQYFHACPPLSASEIRAAIAKGASPLTPAQTQQLATADKNSPAADAKTAANSLGDAYLSMLGLKRAGHRDENLDAVKVAAHRDKKTGNVPDSVSADALIVSAGAGVKEPAADAAVP